MFDLCGRMVLLGNPLCSDEDSGLALGMSLGMTIRNIKAKGGRIAGAFVTRGVPNFLRYRLYGVTNA